MARPLVTQCCLAEQIRDAVADRIAAGDYPPGFRLVELTLAKEFGTSQAPVREALRLLEGLRLVEITPRRGSRVRELTPADVRESLVVRAGLERAAAESGSAAHFAANPKAVAELRALNDAMATAIDRRNLRAVAEKNAAFHRAIVSAAGNETLAEMWETFALRPISRLVLASPRADLSELADQHAGIIDALATGDGPTAGKRLWDHALYVARMVETDQA